MIIRYINNIIWTIRCRVAAFADTFVDVIGAHIIYHHCKSKMRDIQESKVVCHDENSTGKDPYDHGSIIQVLQVA